MKLKDATLIYIFAESYYDYYSIEALFLNEAAAIEFGAQNLVDYKLGRRRIYNAPPLLDLDIQVAHDSYEAYMSDPTDSPFWAEYEEYFKEVRNKIAARSKEVEKS